MSEHCFHCGRKATILCDFIIGQKTGGNEGRRRYIDSKDPELYTCDRPLCERCATKGSPLFLCGKSGRVVIDDYCKEHAGQRDDLNPITPEEAAQLQARLNVHLMPIPGPISGSLIE